MINTLNNEREVCGIIVNRTLLQIKNKSGIVLNYSTIGASNDSNAYLKHNQGYIADVNKCRKSNFY